MSNIGKNEELFDYMSLKEYYLISSVLCRIDIFEEQDTLVIELHFQLSPQNQLLKIKFINVVEYYFHYKKERYFYNITYCKFFKKGDAFYISLDPYDETEEIDNNDNDIILCKEIEGFLGW